jgi:chromosome segregation ATPase
MATGEGLPEEIRSWVEERAAERDVDPEAVLARAVVVHREAERLADAEGSADASGVAARLDRLADLDDEIAAVADRLEALDDEVDDLIGDVRERVIQVKRETDTKAPADHDHPDLRETATEAAETADRALATAEAARDAAGDETETEVGDLRETTARLEERAETLARVAVDARDEIRALRNTERERAAADELRRTANRNGDTVAKCGDCGGRVDLGLLSRPRCPHCETDVSGVEPSGLIGKARLRTGTPPALDGETAESDPFADRGG